MERGREKERKNGERFIGLLDDRRKRERLINQSYLAVHYIYPLLILGGKLLQKKKKEGNEEEEEEEDGEARRRDRLSTMGMSDFWRGHTRATEGH